MESNGLTVGILAGDFFICQSLYSVLLISHLKMNYFLVPGIYQVFSKYLLNG